MIYYPDFVVAVDFDETIATEHNGLFILNIEAKNFINTLSQLGATITLWTCRQYERLAKAVEYCKDNDIAIDFVNVNTPIRGGLQSGPKILADIYVDDKNYVNRCIPWDELTQYTVQKIHEHNKKVKELREDR